MEAIAGPSQAALHFVGDEQRARAAAHVSNSLREFRRKRTDTPLATDRLGDDRGGAIGDRGGERLRPCRVDERHRLEQGHERGAVVLVVGDRECPHRPASEPAFDRHVAGPVPDALRVPVPARELETRFVRFCAAVAEEGARESRQRGEARCRLRSEEHTSELQSRLHLVCRLLLEKKKKNKKIHMRTIKYSEQKVGIEDCYY